MPSSCFSCIPKPDCGLIPACRPDRCPPICHTCPCDSTPSQIPLRKFANCACKKPIYDPKTWVALGTTDVVLSRTQLAFTPIPGMSLTFTPRTPYVKLTFTASGDGSAFGNIFDPLTGAAIAPCQTVDVSTSQNGVILRGHGATTPCMQSVNGFNNVSGIPFTVALTTYDVALTTLIPVVPHQLTTINMNWKTYFAGAFDEVNPEPNYIADMNNFAAPVGNTEGNYSHRTLTIAEYTGSVILG